jgi:cytosine/creatinine deaminase
MASYRSVIRNVRQVDGSLVDVSIHGEHISAVTPAGEAHERDDSATVVEGGGRLVLPSFVDLHVHLDKAFVREELPPHDGTLRGAIEVMRERKERYTVEDVADRAARLIRSSVASGVTRIRTHVDVDPAAGLRALEGVRLAAEACRDICDVQIVAFPQEGVIREEAARALMESAVESGADLVGGMPHWEQDPSRQQEHVEFCFDLADKAGLDLDMHVDETDDEHVRTLEMVADEALARGWHRRVTAGHVCSLGPADDEYASRVVAKCAEAGMTIVSNPVTNLVIQGRGDRGVIRRGLTRVAEFRRAGVNLCFGQDNVADGFYPFGRGDMLEIALFAAHAAHLTDSRGLDYLLGSVTDAPARTWGVEAHGIRPGARADLLLFRASSWVEALRLQRRPELVLFRGRPVARTRVVAEIGPMELEGHTTPQ